MRQYRITTENIIPDDPTDCYLAPDDIVHELKILQHMGGLGASARLNNRRAEQQPKIETENKGQIQRENNIKPGTEEWFKLWFSKPSLTGNKE